MSYNTIDNDVTMPGSGRSLPGNRTIDNDVTMPGDERTLLANRYRVVKQLGQGGMGSVWLAEDLLLDNKQFAIKMLPSILVSNKRAYRQLKDEALVAMKLTHSNIVQLRAFEENNGNPFLVMDYIDGQSLDDYLEEKGKLSEDEAIKLLKPIAVALDYAHGEGVVHRDVKPGNVMIRKDGRPFVLDFGIAREMQETMTRVTGKLSSGTLLYMSPEQLNGAPPTKGQDIYSFAAMAYECLKGEPPFSRGQIEHQILNNPPPPLVGYGATNTPLVAGIMSGLAKKPEDRPPTCMGVLSGAVSAQSRKAVAPSRVERAERVESDRGGARSNGSLGKVVGVLGLIIGAFGLGALLMSNRTEMPSKAEVRTEPTDRRELERKADPDSDRGRGKNCPEMGRDFTIDRYSLGMKMKWCPAGTFIMGSPTTEEGRTDYETQHRVTLTKGFWMGETEVTQGQWKRLMDGETVVEFAKKALRDDTPYDWGGGNKKTIRDYMGMSKNDDPQEKGICGDVSDNVPVYWVSWNDAVEFCRRLTQKERAEGRIPDGYEYRLPTEAEWEYACRAGTTTALPNGKDIRIRGDNNAPALDEIAWYGGNSSQGFSGRGFDTSGWKDKQYPGGMAFAREVMGKKPNKWGLYDMIGNVLEWCGDWYGSDYYKNSPSVDPQGPASGDHRVLRGGCWFLYARFCRPANRAWGEPGFRYCNLGFRVALAPSH